MANNFVSASAIFCQDYRRIDVTDGSDKYTALSLDVCFSGVTPINTKSMCIIINVSASTGTEKEDITIEAYENSKLAFKSNLDNAFIIRDMPNINLKTFVSALEVDEIEPGKLFDIKVIIKDIPYNAGSIITQ